MHKSNKKDNKLGMSFAIFHISNEQGEEPSLTGDISRQIISLSALSLSLRYMYSHEEKHGKLLKEAPGSKCIQHDRTLLLHANEDIYKDVHSILSGMT